MPHSGHHCQKGSLNSQEVRTTLKEFREACLCKEDGVYILTLSKIELKRGFKCFSEHGGDLSMSAGCGKKLAETNSWNER